VYNALLSHIGRRVHLEKLNRAENNGERIQKTEFKDQYQFRDNNLDNRFTFVGVSPQEIKFMSLLKLILDAGWCFD